MRKGPGLQLELSEAPVGAAILDHSLDEHGAALRVQAQELLRAEGFATATQGAAKALDAALDSLEEHRQGLLDSVAETAASLAVEIAEELLRKELSQGNYDIVTIVRECLGVAGHSLGGTTLRVSPVDAESLGDVPFRSGTEIQADPTVRQGDVQVRTDQGLLVREIDECVRGIREKLREALRP